jgi:hypothetical protein
MGRDTAKGRLADALRGDVLGQLAIDRLLVSLRQLDDLFDVLTQVAAEQVLYLVGRG